MPPQVKQRGAAVARVALGALADGAAELPVRGVEVRDVPPRQFEGGRLGVLDYEGLMDVVLSDEVGPEGSHRQAGVANGAGDPPARLRRPILLVHPRLVGFRRQRGPELARQEDHRLGLRGVGPQADAVEESGEDVEGDLELVGVPGDDEAVVRVEAGQEAPHVLQAHPVVRLEDPGPLSHDGVDY